jgi:hypothetical protein
MSNLCRTLQKGVCPWHIHRTLSVLEILIDGNPSYLNLSCSVFQAQIPNKPVGYPKGFSCFRSRKSRLSPQDLHPTTSMQLHDPSPQGPLGSIHGRGPQVQRQTCHAHILPNAPPTHPHQEPMASPRVPPTPLCTPLPRVHPTMISPRVPGTLPTRSPSIVQKSLFSPDLSGEGP